jgi:epsilon-lactone hydrolase
MRVRLTRPLRQRWLEGGAPSSTNDDVCLGHPPGMSGHLDDPTDKWDNDYFGKTDPHDPVMSPIFADLHGMPPTLFITSTRDLLLSGTSRLHLAFLNAGDDAQLVVYEALPHAFWNTLELPESRDCFEKMAKFLDGHVGR